MLRNCHLRSPTSIGWLRRSKDLACVSGEWTAPQHFSAMRDSLPDRCYFRNMDLNLVPGYEAKNIDFTLDCTFLGISTMSRNLVVCWY